VSAILCAKGMRSCVADVNVGSAGPFVRRLLPSFLNKDRT